MMMNISMVNVHDDLLIRFFERFLSSFQQPNISDIDTIDNDFDDVYRSDIVSMRDKHIEHFFEPFAWKSKIDERWKERNHWKLYFEKTFATFTSSNTIMMRSWIIVTNETKRKEKKIGFSIKTNRNQFDTKDVELNSLV